MPSGAAFGPARGLVALLIEHATHHGKQAHGRPLLVGHAAHLTAFAFPHRQALVACGHAFLGLLWVQGAPVAFDLPAFVFVVTVQEDRRQCAGQHQAHEVLAEQQLLLHAAHVAAIEARLAQHIAAGDVTGQIRAEVCTEAHEPRAGDAVQGTGHHAGNHPVEAVRRHVLRVVAQATLDAAESLLHGAVNDAKNPGWVRVVLVGCHVADL